MTPPDPDLSPLSVIVAVLLALGLGPHLAQALGAYSLILIAWFGGVLVGLYRRPSDPRASAVGFVLVTLIVTLGIAVPAAELLARNMPLVDAKALLFPVAVAVPAIGHNWFDVGSWLWGLLRKRTERREGDR